MFLLDLIWHALGWFFGEVIGDVFGWKKSESRPKEPPVVL
jgi:hypothetical protein